MTTFAHGEAIGWAPPRDRVLRIYVASSWRNPFQQNTVAMLRSSGYEVYDFQHPPGGDHLGFSWAEIDPDWRNWRASQYVAALGHPIARAGFASDFEAMRWADVGILLLPCGRSAHLEAGWMAGAGKPVLVLLDESEFSGIADQTGATELMYLLLAGVHTTFEGIARSLERIAS